ncbi:MAG: hypothetical protein M9962_09265 [Oligoflexia bacterium]|nr:hypothetical protein [Oligoflexia bacterium]
MERNKKHEKKFNPRKMDQNEDDNTVREQRDRSKDNHRRPSAERNRTNETWNN